MLEITKDVAQKVLNVVDAGLTSGMGWPEPGNMCVEAAVCYALGLRHSDDPQCVDSALRALKIRLNDSDWSSNEARAKGLRRLAVAQLGSKDNLDQNEFSRRLVDLAIRKQVPIALRAAASIHKDSAHKAAMLAAAERCEKEGTVSSARAAADAAAVAARVAADAARAAYAAARAAYAAARAAYAAAYAAADAARAAARAAHAAARAAHAACAADKVLSDFAEAVVQILIDLKAPGCEWLALTEA